MSKLSWQNDPHGCFADMINEQIAEAMFAAHTEEHSANWEPRCEWCEREQEAEEAEAMEEAWQHQREQRT